MYINSVGTSLGGITTMLVNESAPERVKAAIINDVGPELAPEGIARIAGYAGKTKTDVSDLEEAAAEIRAVNGVAFPPESGMDQISPNRSKMMVFPWTLTLIQVPSVVSILAM